jgi:hypothetical protein
MMGSTRRSKRAQPTGSLDEASSCVTNKKAKKLATRVSVRLVNNCCEFGIPNDLCCSSCQKYIDIPERKRKDRSEYAHRTYQCYKPYEFDARCLKMPRNKIWLQKLDAWFTSVNVHRISSLVAQEKIIAPPTQLDSRIRANSTSINASATSNEAQTTTNSGCPPATVLPDPLLVGEDTPSQEPPPQPQQQPKRNIAIENVAVRVEGAEHIIQDVPKTHAAVSRSYLKMLQKKAAQIDTLQQSIRKKKYTGSPLSKRLLASALVSVPGFSLTGAELVIPLVVAAFLADSNLIDDKIDLTLFSKSFASAHNLRDIVISSAVDSLIEIGNEICGADNVFMSCDKGNKKGLSHFVKILSWWDRVQKQVKTFVLDIDASEGTSEGCAEAIQHSMKKLNNTLALLILTGQTTDSGGGGVLESLMEELKKRDLCTPTYLVASCTLHAIQIALANPVKKTLGEGALGARAMMQMLHSAYDLQESMEFGEFKLIMIEASQWVQQQQAGDLPAADAYDPRIKDFLVNAWDRVNDFALPPDALQELMEKIQKIPQPVLTRWWYVGVAAAFMKQYYRVVLRATQICINIYNAKAKPNIIASGLQSLMKQDIAYSDTLFLAQFHKDFLTQHFEWLQAVDEVAKKPGFRSRQILVRYYLMRKDLEQLRTRIDRNAFGDYDTNLNNFSNEKKARQKRKSEAFIEEAIVSLDKHYLRWGNELLTAALGGEAPLGKVVARVLLNHHLPENPNEENQVAVGHYSKDHDRHIDLLDFASFVRLSYTRRETEMDPKTKSLAELVARGVDIWKEEDGVLTQNDATIVTLRDHFCSVYLPLASNSQFVEAGVKEAKIVSTTGRNEELRSVYAICRSFLFEKLKPTKNTPDRVVQILGVAIEQNAIHEEETTKAARKERRKEVTSALREDHFRNDRLEKKQAKISTKGREDKADNVTQKLDGIEDTPFIDGKTQYGKLRMDDHTEDLVVELTFRECEDFLLLGWKDKLNVLKRHEQLRDPTGDKRFFFAQSEAPFIITKL